MEKSGHERALSSPTPREKQRMAGGPPSVYAGWLFVEARKKREFKWRFCVLDGVHFQVYAQEMALRDRATAAANAHHLRDYFIVHVERMHRLNKGMLLVDRGGYGLWVHGTHDETYYEHWLAMIQAAVANQSIRLTISRYGFLHQSSESTRLGDGYPTKKAHCGWLRVRRTYVRGWVVCPAQRMYCVQFGRHFSAFKLNIEGRWADIDGKVKSMQYPKIGKWLGLCMDDGSVLQVMAKTDDVTEVWINRLEVALRNKSLPISSRNDSPRATTLSQPPRRILTI